MGQLRRERPEGARRLDKTIGQNLKELRELNGWSADQVARSLKTTADAVRKQERGDRSVSVYNLLKYEALYSTPLSEIIYGKTITQSEQTEPPVIELSFDHSDHGEGSV